MAHHQQVSGSIKHFLFINIKTCFNFWFKGLLKFTFSVFLQHTLYGRNVYAYKLTLISTLKFYRQANYKFHSHVPQTPRCISPSAAGLLKGAQTLIYRPA